MSEQEIDFSDEGAERGDEPPRVPLWPSDEEWCRAREKDAELRQMIREHNDWRKLHDPVKL